MIKIPGEFIALLTLPGIPFHELSHWLACKISQVKVLKVCYLNSELKGYVVHEFPSSLWKSSLITLSPLVIGYGTSITLCLTASSLSGFLQGFLIWLAFSIAIHSLPSGEDINSLWAHARGFVGVLYTTLGPVEIYQKAPLAPRVFLFPGVLCLRILNGLRPLWSDFILAFMVLGPILWW